MNTKLPEEYFKEGLKLADGCSMFWTPITELSKDELLACLANEIQAHAKSMKNHIDHWESLRKIKQGV